MKRILASCLAALTLVAASASPSFSQQSKTHLGGKASSMVHLWANLAPDGIPQPFALVSPEGTSMGTFAVPEGTVLIVTDLTVGVNGPPAPGVTRGGVLVGAYSGPYFSVDFSKQAGQSIHLTGGAVYSLTPMGINSWDSANYVFMDVYGYLAKDQ